jgi:hypothetical protein
LFEQHVEYASGHGFPPLFLWREERVDSSSLIFLGGKKQAVLRE